MVEGYYERRRRLREQEENHSPDDLSRKSENPDNEAHSQDTPEVVEFASDTRPTKKDSMKENKKHPYKKVRK